jgi:hypothetical protein
VPKDYFVEQPGVHADPDELGRELGDGVGRGEDELILAALRTSLRVRSISLEDLPGAVVSVAQNLTAQGLHPTVLVMNSWDILEALGPVTDGANRIAIADLEDAVKLRDGKTQVLLRYGGDGDFCVVADLEQAFEVTFGDPLIERPDDHVLGNLLVGVERIDSDRARSLVEANPDLRRAEGAALTVEEAELKVQQSAHVRVLEWLSVDGREQNPALIFDIEGTS